MIPWNLYQPDPDLDLVLERVVDLPPDAVWRAWTTPELILKWLTPAPWKTIDCEIELRPEGWGAALDCSSRRCPARSERCYRSPGSDQMAGSSWPSTHTE